MGTFHSDKGELHGITVVVDTSAPAVWIGRCDTVAAEGVVLLDAANCLGTDEERAAFLSRAARLGVFPELPRVVVPTADVERVRRLADVAAETAADRA